MRPILGSIALAALAILAAPAFASPPASGLTEKQLMGVYQRCLIDQVKPMHPAAFNVELQRVSRPNDRFEEPPFKEKGFFNDPVIGPAHLDVSLSIDGDDFTPYKQYQIDLSFNYRSGKVSIDPKEDDPYSFECFDMSTVGSSTSDDQTKRKCQAKKHFGIGSIYVPYFQYETVKKNGVNYVKGEPVLMTFKQNPDLLWLKPDGGNWNKDYDRGFFDVGVYKGCLRNQLKRVILSNTVKTVKPTIKPVVASRFIGGSAISIVSASTNQAKSLPTSSISRDVSQPAVAGAAK